MISRCHYCRASVYQQPYIQIDLVISCYTYRYLPQPSQNCLLPTFLLQEPANLPYFPTALKEASPFYLQSYLNIKLTLCQLGIQHDSPVFIHDLYSILTAFVESESVSIIVLSKRFLSLESSSSLRISNVSYPPLSLGMG